MARYIDADLLIKKIFPLGMIDGGNFPVNAKAVKVTIDKLPTADVVEVKHGKWIENKKVCDSPYCSVCGAIGSGSYCHHCGAKMDLVGD